MIALLLRLADLTAAHRRIRLLCAELATAQRDLATTRASLSRVADECAERDKALSRAVTERTGSRRYLAAGWRPPARVITDPAELDALPTGAVVLDHARPRDAYTKRAHGYGWYGTGSSLSATSSEVLRWGEDRVTVLWTPGGSE